MLSLCGHAEGGSSGRAIGTCLGGLDAGASDLKLEKTTLEALLGARVDELNGLRISTVAALEGGRVFGRTCASAPPEVLSPTCRRVLGSLRVDQE